MERNIINVIFHIRPCELQITFPRLKQAEAYKSICNKKGSSYGMRVSDNDVFWKLPTQVLSIEASGTYGLILTFESPESREDYHDELRKVANNDPRQLYIKRNWSEKTLNEALNREDDDMPVGASKSIPRKSIFRLPLKRQEKKEEEPIRSRFSLRRQQDHL